MRAMKFKDILETRIIVDKIRSYNVDKDGDLSITMDFNHRVYLTYNSIDDRIHDINELDSKFNIRY